MRVILATVLMLLISSAGAQDFYFVNEALYQDNKLDNVKANSLHELAMNKESIEAYYFMALVSIRKESSIEPSNIYSNKYTEKFQELYRRRAKELNLMFGEQIMLSDIRFVRLFHYIGLKYLSEHSYDKSVEWLNLAEIGYEKNFNFNLHISQSYYGIKNYEKSIKYLNLAHSIQPNNSDVTYNIGCMHSLLGNVPESINWIEKAILLNPKYKEMAPTDSDLNNIRHTEQYKNLMSR